jgi:uncharacterized protein (TIGR03435 family)
MESLLTWIRRGTLDQRVDTDLLAAFFANHDDLAFAEVVRRHGPVVWGVCRRMLPDPADAEDAFQATFLVLVRRGNRPLAPLAPWLYRVAVLTARGVRRRNIRRLTRLRPLPTDIPTPPAPASDELDGLLLRMPEKYRVAIVLCCLEGLTEREAAERLGCPVGTLSARTSRGLAWLRKRLGGDPRAAFAAVVLTAVPATTAAAAVRVASLVQISSQMAAPPAVSSIVEGVVRMLWIKNVARATTAVVLVAAAGLALGLAAVTAGGDAAGRTTRSGVDPGKKVDTGSETPAVSQEPKPTEPAWRAAFQKAFGLKDGEILKRVSAPYPACREEWFNEMYAGAFQPAPSADNAYLFYRFRNKQVVRGTMDYRVPAFQNSLTGKLSLLIEGGFRFSLQEVEAASDLLDTDIEGEFVFRDGTTPERWVPALEKILREECGLKLRFKLKELEREVVVASGEFKSKPQPGQRANCVVVSTPTDAQLEGGSIGTYEEFVAFLSQFIEKRIVSDVMATPKVQFAWKHRIGTMLRKEGRNVYTEDHDPDTVLKAVADQTGLTFKTEKRKVRVLCVEKAE